MPNNAILAYKYMFILLIIGVPFLYLLTHVGLYAYILAAF